MAFSKINRKPNFAPDFSGRVGAYFRAIKLGKRRDSEVLKLNADTQAEPSGRRWLQFLNKGEQISRKYRNDQGQLDLEQMATEYGCTIEPYTDPSTLKVSTLPEVRKIFDVAKDKGWAIQGFSLPKRKKIFYREDIKKNQKNFVIAHELAHFLLGHKELAFCKGNPLEREEYNEEADRLAAILLMPHSYIKDNMEKNDDEIATHFGVSPEAVSKRKREVEKEINVLCYDWQN